MILVLERCFKNCIPSPTTSNNPLNIKSVKNKMKGDAMISEVKDVSIGILTADCAPILFYEPNKKIIGCAHSGWKGALNGIIKNTVEKFL